MSLVPSKTRIVLQDVDGRRPGVLYSPDTKTGSDGHVNHKDELKTRYLYGCHKNCKKTICNKKPIRHICHSVFRFALKCHGGIDL